jgi:hypothetical protein
MNPNPAITGRIFRYLFEEAITSFFTHLFGRNVFAGEYQLLTNIATYLFLLMLQMRGELIWGKKSGSILMNRES